MLIKESCFWFKHAQTSTHRQFKIHSENCRRGPKLAKLCLILQMDFAYWPIWYVTWITNKMLSNRTIYAEAGFRRLSCKKLSTTQLLYFPEREIKSAVQIWSVHLVKQIGGHAICWILLSKQNCMSWHRSKRWWNSNSHYGNKTWKFLS